MKNLKKWITSPTGTIALFVLAAGLLLFSTIGSAWAALKYFSEIYKGHVEMYDIGVELLEKSDPEGEAERVAWRTYKQNTQDEWDETPGEDHIGVLLANMLPAKEGGEEGEKEELVPGKHYFEEISCRNSGTIDEYVRITLYKYWVNADGEKVFTASADDPITTQGLSPALINFTFPYLGSDWILDEKNSAETEERQIYYYNKLLKAGEDTSATPLTGTLTIDQLVGLKVNKEVSDDGKTITVSYKYDGWKFCVEAAVDAVQDHNAEDAIRSAWGRDVTISNGTLTLKND